MKPPERKEIADIIASPCLIRKDRAGRALFISDFLQRVKEPQKIKKMLLSKGYILHELNEKLVLIDWTKENYTTYFNSLSEIVLPNFDNSHAMVYGTCRLLMQHEAALETQDMEVLSFCLRLALLGQMKKLLHTLQSALADALREKRPPPYHGAKLCMAFWVNNNQ